MSLTTSFHAVTALGPNGPLAMFGVSPRGLLSGRGTPWFLGRDEVFEYARDLMLRGPKIIAWFQETFPEELSNIVSVENTRAVAMLRHWGAVVGGDPQIHGGLEFVPFAFRAAIQARSRAA